MLVRFRFVRNPIVAPINLVDAKQALTELRLLIHPIVQLSSNAILRLRIASRLSEYLVKLLLFSRRFGLSVTVTLLSYSCSLATRFTVAVAVSVL